MVILKKLSVYYVTMKGMFSLEYLGKCAEMVYRIMLPLMTLTLLSVYCLFYYVVWFDFKLINITFVYEFLPLDSENY